MKTGPLTPRPGFNWAAVVWEPGDKPPGNACSYCNVALDDDDEPLILWDKDGDCARFCESCQERWFGVETYDSLDDP